MAKVLVSGVLARTVGGWVAYFVLECPAGQEFVRFNEIKVRK